MRFNITLIIVSFIVTLTKPVPTQSQKSGNLHRRQHVSVKDTLDGKFDLSTYLADAHGFLPIPLIITEPALGGYGLAVLPTFISPKKNLPEGLGYVPPDITAAMAMYTGNKSWALGAFRSGNLPKAGIKYRVGLAYGDINLSFYRSIAGAGEKEFEFGIKSLPVFLSLSKKITQSGLYVGLKYTWMDTKLTPHSGGNLPDFIRPKEIDSKTGDLGVFLDYDKRNTVFTPDKGIHTQVSFSVNDNWTGSDYEYQKLAETFVWFLPVKKYWVSGLRVEGHQAFNDPPFYLQPTIDMRGIPSARYQGKETYLVETEQRFDLTSRWSVLGFGGWGTALAKGENFGAGQNVYNAGAGFRYLIARLFKLRAGIDVARGPDSWGWYVVFGHSWNR